MPILIKGTDFTDGDQVTAVALDALVDSATFDSGAVDASTTALSGGAIIVKDLGVTAAKLETATNGQLMIGNGTGFTKAALTAGTGITITNGSGAITIAAGVTGANPSATIAGAAVNGTASTFMRSDAVPALSLTIAQLNSAVTDADVAILGANTFTALQTFKAGADIASATAIDLTAATGNTVVITGTTPSTSLTMTAGQQMLLLPSGAWPMTFHATTMNINGGVSYTCAAGDRVFAAKDLAGVIRVSVIKQDGTSLVAVTSGAGDHEVVVTTSNGHGSTSTYIRRFTTTQSSVGTAITYADSATLGGTFTINEAGLYSLYYGDAGSINGNFGISLNSSELTTSILSITAASRLCVTNASNSAGNRPTAVSVVVKLAASDVIRAHDDISMGGSTAYQLIFRIRRIGSV